jgi:hypothetical protein
LKPGKEYWGTLAATLGTYVKALKVIRFPAVAAAAAAGAGR